MKCWKIWGIWKIEIWSEELVDGHQTAPYQMELKSVQPQQQTDESAIFLVDLDQ